MSDSLMSHAEYMRHWHRAHNLPEQLAKTEARLRQLRARALEYGMGELLRESAFVDLAWDQTIREAQAEARRNGDSIGFGDNGQ